MTEMERLVWAAAYAAVFANDYEERRGRDSEPDGFSCAEVADLAVAKYREAMTGIDAGYLMAVEEKWPCNP